MVTGKTTLFKNVILINDTIMGFKKSLMKNVFVELMDLNSISRIWLLYGKSQITGALHILARRGSKITI